MKYFRHRYAISCQRKDKAIFVQELLASYFQVRWDTKHCMISFSVIKWMLSHIFLVRKPCTWEILIYFLLVRWREYVLHIKNLRSSCFTSLVWLLYTFFAKHHLQFCDPMFHFVFLPYSVSWCLAPWRSVIPLAINILPILSSLKFLSFSLHIFIMSLSESSALSAYHTSFFCGDCRMPAENNGVKGPFFMLLELSVYDQNLKVSYAGLSVLQDLFAALLQRNTPIRDND